MLSKAQVLEGEVILGQYLATENVEQVNDLFSHLWIKMHLYFLIIFICFAAESKIQTLPKALRTQALTSLTSNFGLVAWFSMLGRLHLI